jgi:CxxC motif-containing protein
MPKKQLFYFTLIILMAALIWFLSNDKKSTISVENNFSISDTASVSKIFIADRNGTTITLNRNEKNWVINNKYEVRKDAIKTILTTINQIRIQRPVSITAFDNVIKNLATTGVKIEIYTNQDAPEKTYTIGGSTSNHLGSYMFLAGSETPFIVHIPSFNGFLSPRYGIEGNKISEKNWRTTNIFSLKTEKISRVIVNHIQEPEKSFTLTTASMILLNNLGNEVSLNQENALQFLNAFKLLNCESFKDIKERKESTTPLHELIVNNDTLRTYSIGNGKLVKDKEDNFTVKRMHATLNNGELMLIQDYVFNKVLITIDQLQ